MTTTDIWTIIGVLGIKPTYDTCFKKWTLHWTDENSGKSFWGEGETIETAAYLFVNNFLTIEI